MVFRSPVKFLIMSYIYTSQGMLASLPRKRGTTMSLKLLSEAETSEAANSIRIVSAPIMKLTVGLWFLCMLRLTEYCNFFSQKSALNASFRLAALKQDAWVPR